VHICAFCLGFCPAVHRPARAHGFRFRAAPRAVPHARALRASEAICRGRRCRRRVACCGARCGTSRSDFESEIRTPTPSYLLRSRTGRGPQAITAHAPRARWPLSADYALMVRRG